MERVVLPFSGLASWVLILGGVLATLQVLGINIQPLLTVGGVSGIVVGLSAQSVMSNMISGINLVSRMFNYLGLCDLLKPPSPTHCTACSTVVFPTCQLPVAVLDPKLRCICAAIYVCCGVCVLQHPFVE